MNIWKASRRHVDKALVFYMIYIEFYNNDFLELFLINWINYFRVLFFGYNSNS